MSRGWGRFMLKFCLLRSAYWSLVLRRSGRPFPPSLTYSTVVLYYRCIPSTSRSTLSLSPRLSTSLPTSDTSPSIHHSIYTGIVVLYKLYGRRIYAPAYSDIRTYRTAPELNQKQEVRQAPASRPAAQSKAGREAGAGAISPCAGVEGCREAATVPG